MGRRIPCVVDRVGDAAVACQRLAHALRLTPLGIGLWRQPGSGFEEAVEIARAEPQRIGKLAERGRCLAVLDDAAGPGHHLGIHRFRGRPVGLAPLAGPEPSSPRAFERVVDGDVCGIATARGT